jgi:glycosyltransferase involved in cell wall biosynthesis
MSNLTVYFASKVRGFFIHLFSNKRISAQFIYATRQIFETNSTIRKLLIKLVHTKLFDILGIIQIIHCKNKKCDIYGSSNRFLKSDRPYFIYLETPVALFNYSLKRHKTFLGRKKLKYLADHRLKALIFMSNACASSFEPIYGAIPSHIIKETIYPYIPKNNLVSFETIKTKSQNKELKLLYISQGVSFISKGGLEILEAFKKLRNAGYSNIVLTIITSISEVDISLVEDIKKIEGITLYDFTFSYEALTALYADSHILLHPTSHDSFGLTILEALKAGLPVLASKLYNIPELIKDGINGFLTEPHYWLYDSGYIPNPKVWNNMRKTVHSNQICDRIVSFLYNSILLLYNDRNLLEKMSMSSFEIANSPPFDEDTITGQWNNILNKIK